MNKKMRIFQCFYTYRNTNYILLIQLSNTRMNILIHLHRNLKSFHPLERCSRGFWRLPAVIQLHTLRGWLVRESCERERRDFARTSLSVGTALLIPNCVGKRRPGERGWDITRTREQKWARERWMERDRLTEFVTREKREARGRQCEANAHIE